MAKYFKSINTGNITNGNYAEVTWTPDRDVTIRKMMLSDRSDQSLAAAQVFISIADVPYTKDYVPGNVIGSDPQYCYAPDIPVPKGAQIYVKVGNNTGATINCDIVFECE